MICKITFTVNGQSRELSLETDSASPLTDQDIITVLQNNPEYCKELSEQIRQASIQSVKNKQTSIKELQGINGLIGNCDLEFLKNQPKFAEIQFPPVEANILLLNNLSIGRKNIYGRKINSQGQELFIIKNNEEDVKKLATFLNVRHQINELGFTLSEDSKWNKPLNEILKLREDIKDIPDLIIDFMYNQSNYRNIYINSDGKQESAIGILSKVIRTIKDWSMPTSYDDPIINEINLQKTLLQDGEAFLAYDRLYSILSTYDSNLLKTLGITSIKSMKEYLSRPISETRYKFPRYFQLSENDKTGFDFLLGNLFISEPEFTYKFVRKSDKGIILKQQFTTLESKYGFGYDTVSTMDIINPNYKGYKIYRYVKEEGGQPRFYVSRGYLTEQNNSKKFKSEQEALDWIENSIKFQSLRKNSLLEFKFRDSTVDESGNIIYDNSLNSETIASQTSFIQGQIIEVLDIPINKNTSIIGSELDLIANSKATIRDFVNTVNKWNIPQELKTEIIEKINTPEKAVAFIYKINEILKENRENIEQIQNILKIFDEASINTYFIEKRSFVSSTRGWNYRIIPTTPDIVTDYKQDKGKPVVTWMQAISEALSKQFGINVHLMTSSEIKEQLSNVADPNIDKAFIYNGEVYVNTTIAKTTDLLHEYIHLVLGALRSNPEFRQNYEQLMLAIVSTDEGKDLYNTLLETYSGLSQMDVMEEVFAKMFSGYIRNNITMGTKEIFQASEDTLKNATKTIFNTKISDIRKFYGENPITIFAKFNKDVANTLSKKNLDFGQNMRIYSNYISKQIKEGNIKEEC